MKMKKWLKCLLMSMMFMMAVTAVPAAAEAAVAVKAGKTFTSGNFKYKVTSKKGRKGTATLTGIKSKSIKTARIPKTVKVGKYTLTVNAIGKGAFANCKKLKKVVTNNAIKKIESNAFSGCKKLTAVDIKSTVLKSAGKNALAGISAKAVVSVPKGKGVSYENLLKVKVKDPAAIISGSTTAPKAAAVSGAGQNTAGAGQNTPSEAPEKEICGKKHLGLKVVESVAPTCTKTGLSSWQYCIVCGYKTTPVTISAVGHNMAAHAEEPASCTAPGRTAYESCTRCGYVAGGTVIPKLAHELTEVAGKEATCTAKGWEPYEVCRKCGYQTSVHYLNALGHNYGAWTVAEEASCTEEGREERVCSRCQDKTERVIAAKGHHCENQEWLKVEGSCYEKLVYSCTECSYKERTRTTRHSDAYMEKMADVAPSCTQDGRKNRSCCSMCGQEDFSRVPKLGHSFTGARVRVEPTCISEGAVYEKCGRCDEKKLVEVLPTVGRHTWEDASKAATCTEKGFSGQKCSVCGATQGREISAAGHQYEVTEKPAGCDTKGERKETCKKCNKTKLTVLPALGHDFTKEVIEPATCTKDGGVYRKCSRCDEKQLERTIQSQGEHTWADATSYVLKSNSDAAAVNENTECRMTRFLGCTVCHMYKVIPGRGHVAGENCPYTRAKEKGKQSGYIQWTVFLSETGWESVDMGSQCSTLLLNGKEYASYIPTMRSDVEFKAPVPKCPEDKVFVYWQQVVSDGDTVSNGVRKVTNAAFDDTEAGKTYVAVFADK